MRMISLETKVKEAIIPCAGRGVRMGSLVDDIPKPMIPFESIPFLQFVLYHLKQAGYNRFIIPIAYKGEKIKEYFGDGSGFGVEIEYVQSTIEAESGGSFFRGIRRLKGEYCLMQYGDAFFPSDMKDVTEAFLKSGKMGMVVASKRYTIEGFADKNNLEVDPDGTVLAYGKGNPKAEYLDTGVALFRKEVIDMLEGDEFKLAPMLFPKLIERGELAAYRTDIKSVGIGNQEKVERFMKFLEGKDLLDKVRAMKK